MTATQLTQQQQSANYYPILAIIEQVDADLINRTRHYRNKAGRLLTTLDEVVRAILQSDLRVEAE